MGAAHDRRASAIATLTLIAEDPAALAGHATLAAALDALATVYATNPTDGLSPAQVALRSSAAVWRTMHAHAEHRIKGSQRAEG